MNFNRLSRRQLLEAAALSGVSAAAATPVVRWLWGISFNRLPQIVQVGSIPAVAGGLSAWTPLALTSRYNTYTNRQYTDTAQTTEIITAKLAMDTANDHWQYRVYSIDTVGRFAQDSTPKTGTITSFSLNVTDYHSRAEAAGGHGIAGNEIQAQSPYMLNVNQFEDGHWWLQIDYQGIGQIYDTRFPNGQPTTNGWQYPPMTTENMQTAYLQGNMVLQNILG